MTRLLALFLLCLPTWVLATGEREKARLETLREQRQQLERKLEKSESTRTEAAGQLRDIEKSISDVGRKLRSLSDERAVAKAELTEHERELQRLESQLAVRQGQLARLLRHQFRPQEADAFAVMLAGGDPNATARDRHFLALLSRAKADLIAAIRRDAGDTRRVAAEVKDRNDKLAELVRREEQERANLRSRQQDRQVVLGKLAREIREQRREIGSLKQNEARLGNLIASLARQGEAKKRAQAANQAAKRTDSAGKAPRAAAPPITGKLASEPRNAGGSFARLRGSLPQPVSGTLTARFGARRDDGQSLWKGLFFRAADGADVRAVAAGEVVFADWLRGYGNLLIIDHDDDFLSVYGNNQSLLADVGQKVGAGTTVATVGASGGQPESGLYFELRHRGQAFDPGKWLKLK